MNVSVDDLGVATSDGNSAIVRVLLANGEGNFVVVDSVTSPQGPSVVAVRDPCTGTGTQYFVSAIELSRKFQVEPFSRSNN